ncbi:ABC transporter ATP-binding protein [Dactylosporangium sp. NPDC051484]|uniref:ABC transporter ATP-binding protein n=1 Tax=Dactylosporangium sp. NPDC051484 TaxID=3154942 RepID=UPI00344DF4C7
MMAPILTVESLGVTFGGGTPAVKDLSFDLYPGETLAVVGESGSGKSVTSLAIMGLLDDSATVTGRAVYVDASGSPVELLGLRERALRRLRGNEISMIFQEPMTALNPVLTVGEQIAEALRLHQGASRRAARTAAVEAMEQVRIPDPARRSGQHPHELSGGMRQRVMIAMAMVCRPRILIADEPTTALDVTIQSQILGLLSDLKDETGAAVVLITHDMGVVAEMADRVVVMQRSRLVEQGAVGEIFHNPREPYTRMLLDAVPRLGALAGIDHPVPFPLGSEDYR